MITLLGFIAVGFWQYGIYGSVTQERVKRGISFIVLIGVITGGYLLSFEYIYKENKEAVTSKTAFSAERLLKNRDSAKISVIEFTADWCPNCRLVEKVTLHSTEVAEAMNDISVDFMVADITGKNRDAERLMLLFKSQAIPLLAIVPPGETFTRPIILRDIYSKKDVLKALASARSGNVKSEFFYQLNIEGVK
jgi:thiol:disulfide interchange protein